MQRSALWLGFFQNIRDVEPRLGQPFIRANIGGGAKRTWIAINVGIEPHVCACISSRGIHPDVKISRVGIHECRIAMKIVQGRYLAIP